MAALIKSGRIKAQVVTLYEHPWLSNWNGFLYDANKESYERSNWVSLALTFKLVLTYAAF